MIDVSELMDDPDFLSPLPVVLIKRSSNVNGFGEGSLVETPTPIAGIVQPGAGDELERLPESARLKESIRVWSRAVMQVESPGGYADIITWDGKRWIVTLSIDYSKWGAGYTKAVCVFESMVKP